MKLDSITLDNIRCFRGVHTIRCGEKVNLFVGPNNSGKTTILKSIYYLQGLGFNNNDFSINTNNGRIEISFKSHIGNNIINGKNYNLLKGENIFFAIENFSFLQIIKRGQEHKYDDRPHLGEFLQFPSREPDNLIYPFFSKRKVGDYNKHMDLDNTNYIDGTFGNLYAKVDRLINPSKSYYNTFVEACKNILGFEISSESTTGGKISTYSVNDNRSIELTSMGEGVANMLGLIASLCIAKDKIFIIEEPENDIHPKALKSLLKLIESISETNQFFISTHSNIVVKYLGGNVGNKIFQIVPEMDRIQIDRIPISNIIEVGESAQDRLKILEDLGYDFFDYSLWSVWLFLEESSAEIIIREFLIPTFTNLTGKLITHSTRSIAETANKFEDFNRLFVYIHRGEIYKNRAWVVIDGGSNEKLVIDQIKSTYIKHGWTEDHFRQFSKHDFEEFYPARFATEVNAIKSIDETIGNRKQIKQQKRELKYDLLNKVKAWYKSNPIEAKREFSESAKEIIDLLKEIELSLEHK